MAIQAGDVVWQIGANLDGLKKGLQDGLGHVQTTSERVAQTMAKVGKGFTVVGGAITGTLTGIVYKWNNYADEVGKAAERTGMTTNQISELGYAARQSDAQLSDVTNAVRRMSTSLRDAENGSERAIMAFETLGVSVDDLRGKSPYEIFLILADAIAGTEMNTERLAAMNDILGRSAQNLLPMLNLGSHGLRELGVEAQRAGLSLDQTATDAARDFNDAIQSLREALLGVVGPIAEALTPSVTRLAENIRDTIHQVQQWLRQNQELVATVVKVVGAIGLFMVSTGPLLMMMPGLVALVKVVVGVFAALSAKVLVVAAVVGVALVGAFMILRRVFDEAIVWVRANWDRITALFETGVQIVQLQLELLAQVFRAVFTIVVAILAGFGLSIVEGFHDVTGNTALFQGDFLDIMQDLANMLTVILGEVVRVVTIAADWLNANWEHIVAGAQWASRMIIEPMKTLIGWIESALRAWQRISRVMPQRLLRNVLGFADGGVIPGFADGGIVDHRLVMVGERGPELAALPVGTRVLSHADTMKAASQSGGGRDVNVNIDMRGTVIEKEADADSLVEKLSALMTTRFSEAGVQYG